MLSRLPYLFLAAGAALLTYAAWLVVEHVTALRTWDRIVARVPTSELRQVQIVTGPYGRPLTRIAQLDYAISEDSPAEQEILITRSVPYRARQPRWSTVLFPAFVLLTAAAAHLAIGFVLCAWARRPENSPNWRLTAVAPPSSPNAPSYSRPRSVAKANLMWASFGLLGVVPNLLGPAYPWMWIASLAFSGLYCGLFVLLAWHNATCRYWITAGGVAAASSLGAQFVPFPVIGKITDHFWRDVERPRGESRQAQRRSVGRLVSRHYRLYDRDGGLLLSLPRDLQPSYAPLLEAVVRKTGFHIAQETTKTTSFDN
ncbi:MAG: hypothetical protein IT168_00190 [Bryobacterales bacterium]|nr:hypothetical protein [Bryobacterales bacterium]